jgi:spore coat protein U-like protein
VVVPGPATNRSFTVYGGIFLNQSGEVGRYSDVLRITVTP